MADCIFAVTQRLAAALRGTAALRCDGVNLLLADSGDGFGFRFGPDYADLPERHVLDAAAYHLREAVERAGESEDA